MKSTLKHITDVMTSLRRTGEENCPSLQTTLIMSGCTFLGLFIGYLWGTKNGKRSRRRKELEARVFHIDQDDISSEDNLNYLGDLVADCHIVEKKLTVTGNLQVLGRVENSTIVQHIPALVACQLQKLCICNIHQEVKNVDIKTDAFAVTFLADVIGTNERTVISAGPNCRNIVFKGKLRGTIVIDAENALVRIEKRCNDSLVSLSIMADELQIPQNRLKDKIEVRRSKEGKTCSTQKIDIGPDVKDNLGMQKENTNDQGMVWKRVTY